MNLFFGNLRGCRGPLQMGLSDMHWMCTPIGGSWMVRCHWNWKLEMGLMVTNPTKPEENLGMNLNDHRFNYCDKI